MTNPLKLIFTNGHPTALGEWRTGDSLPVAFGGTGATDAAGARSALGLANHEKVAVDTGGSVTFAGNVKVPSGAGVQTPSGNQWVAMNDANNSVRIGVAGGESAVFSAGGVQVGGSVSTNGVFASTGTHLLVPTFGARADGAWLTALDSSSYASATYGWIFGQNNANGDLQIRRRSGSTLSNTVLTITRDSTVPRFLFGPAPDNGVTLAQFGGGARFDGNVGIGVTPSAWRNLYAKAIQVGDAGASLSAGTVALSVDQYLNVCNNGYVGSDGLWIYTRSKESARYEQFNGESRWFTAPSGTAGSAISWTQAMTLDASGNLLVGVPNGTYRLSVGGYGGNRAMLVNQDTTAEGWGGASTSIWVGKVGATGRSINAGGTINASGADYAEYERNNGATIAKGDIVGFDADGKLTLNFDDAFSFAVKSTDPCMVGGDVWGTEDQVGKRPEQPQFTAPEYAGSQKPANPNATSGRYTSSAEVRNININSDEMYCKPLESVEAIKYDYAAALAQYEADQAAHKANVEAAQAEFDTVTMPDYQKALAEFEAKLEAARQQVDRIAYSGKVPVNVQGAKVGDYIVAASTDTGGITGVAISEDAISFPHYRKAVGRVRRIEPDGRALIAVIVH